MNNRKRMEDLLIAYNRPKAKKSKAIYEKRQKLPALSHNSSAFNFNVKSKFNRSFKELINESDSQDFPKTNKIKSVSSDFDDYDKLVLLSNKNQAMRNKSISIQQKLIEISSNHKLPSIKEIPVFSIETKGKWHIDAVLEKYQYRLKEQLKTLEE